MSKEHKQAPQLERIELDYRAGIKGLRQMARKQGINREDGAVRFVSPTHKLKAWRGGNPFQGQCRRPLGQSPDALRKILNPKGKKHAA